MPGLEVVPGLITCPQCGARNRVAAYAPTLRPVCGRCHYPLQTKIERYRGHALERPRLLVSSLLKNVKTRARLFIWAGVAIAAVLCILLFTSKPNIEIPSPVASVPTPVVGHTPADVAPQRVAPIKAATVPRFAPLAPLKTEAPALQSLQANRRLPNGTIIRRGGRSGEGRLTVKNGLSSDAVAKLIDVAANACVSFFYVSSGADFTLTGVTDGRYRLIFGVGQDWDPKAQSFTRFKSFSEFSKTMDFSTSEEQREASIHTQYTVMEVTLHPVLGGNVKTQGISEEEFRRL